jgi:hypothetical protein
MVNPETVIVCPLVAAVPIDEVTQPAALLVVGAVQPVGTATETEPLINPPVGAV